MNRHRDGDGRRGDARLPSTVPELAVALRRARTRQGLRLEDVSARTGLPLEQLQALETGTVDRIPDRVAILRTLRRYADFLGLPGERFVLSVVDHWPTAPAAALAIRPVPDPATGRSAPVAGPGLDTGVLPAASLAGAGTGVGTGTTPRTRAVGAGATRTDVPRAAAVPPGFQTATTQVPGHATVADTGVVPPYQPRAGGARPGGPRPRQAHTPLGLRVLVGLVALAVVVGIAGLVVHRYEPHWLDDLGITHAPDHGTTTGTTTGPSSSTSTTSASQFAVTDATSTAATISVRSSSFVVQVQSVGGTSWVQTTQSGKSTPTFGGIVAEGQTQQFTVQHSMVMVVGSVAAHVDVLVGHESVGTYVPPAAPFTITFQSAS